MFDTHCHLDAEAFDADRQGVLARAAAQGVRRLVVPGVRPRGWARAWALKGDGVDIAVGLHPEFVSRWDEDERQRFASLGEAATHMGAVAIGECGLDARFGDLDAQERAFRAQLQIARLLGLPVILHIVRAHERALCVLRDEGLGDAGGVVHSYSGSAEQVRAYVELGLYVSFAGPITYRGARKSVAAARAVPIERLVAETDAPDQAPEPYRGTRGEPAHLAHVIDALAHARGVSAAALAAQLEENAQRLFERA